MDFITKIRFFFNYISQTILYHLCFYRISLAKTPNLFWISLKDFLSKNCGLSSEILWEKKKLIDNREFLDDLLTENLELFKEHFKVPTDKNIIFIRFFFEGSMNKVSYFLGSWFLVWMSWSQIISFFQANLREVHIKNCRFFKEKFDKNYAIIWVKLWMY